MQIPIASKISALLEHFYHPNKSKLFKQIQDLVQVCYVSKAKSQAIHVSGEKHPIPMKDWEAMAGPLAPLTGDQLRCLVGFTIRHRDEEMQKDRKRLPTEKDILQMKLVSKGQSEIVAIKVSPTAITEAAIQAILDYKIFKSPRCNQARVDGVELVYEDYIDICKEIFGHKDADVVKDLQKAIIANVKLESVVIKENKLRMKEEYSNVTKEIEQEFLDWVKQFMRFSIVSSGTIIYFLAKDGENTQAVKVMAVSKLSDLSDRFVAILKGGIVTDPNNPATQLIPRSFLDYTTASFEKFSAKYDALVENMNTKDTLDPAMFFAGVVQRAIQNDKIPRIGVVAKCGWSGTAMHFFDLKAWKENQKKSLEENAKDCPIWIDWLKHTQNGHVVGGKNYTTTEAFCCWIYLLLQHAEDMRQGFVIRGPGMSGNTSVGNALRRVFGVVGTDYVQSREASRFTTAKYANKIFATYSENSETRAFNQGAIKKLLGGDSHNVENKFEASYDAVIRMVLFIAGNNGITLNTYDYSEWSRCLVMNSIPRAPGSRIAKAEELYYAQFYPFYAYCEKIYLKYYGEHTEHAWAIHLEIPPDMENHMLADCATLGSKIVRNFFTLSEGCKKTVAIPLGDLTRKLFTWSKTPNEFDRKASTREDEIKYAISQAIFSNRCPLKIEKVGEEKLIHIPDPMPTYTAIIMPNNKGGCTDNVKIVEEVLLDRGLREESLF